MMNAIKGLINLSILLILISACSRKSSESSTIKIQLNQKLFSSSSIPTMASNTDNANGPHWGLNDPTSLSELGCFAVFVGANEPGLNESSCRFADGNSFDFGQRAGFFPVGGTIELEITAGVGRRIYLFGTSSANGSCFNKFHETPDFDFSNYSAPFMIGSAQVDLSGGTQIVPIQVSDTFDSQNRLQDCDFFQDEDGDDGNTASPYLTFFDSKRSVWIDDNEIPRTVQIHHSGSSAECSKDGGTTFINCDTDYIWDVTDYSVNHLVRINYDDGSNEVLNFTPDIVFPGLTFETCDASISASDNLDNLSPSFGGALATTNNVVCLDDGVIVTQGGTNQGPVTLNANGLILAVRQGEYAKIENTTTTNNAVSIAGYSNIMILGLEIDAYATGGTSALIVSSSAQDIRIEDSRIQTNNSGGYSLNVSNAGDTTPIVVKNSVLESMAGGQALKVYSTSGVSVESSELQSNGVTLDVTVGANVNIASSILRNSGVGSGNHLVKTFNGADITIQNSYLVDGSGAGIELDGGTSNTVNLYLDKNTIVRDDTGQSGGNPFITSVVSGGDEYIYSSSHQNFFCNEDTALFSFSTMTDGNEHPSSTFVDTAQSNGNPVVINNCPSDLPLPF